MRQTVRPFRTPTGFLSHELAFWSTPSSILTRLYQTTRSQTVLSWEDFSWAGASGRRQSPAPSLTGLARGILCQSGCRNWVQCGHIFIGQKEVLPPSFLFHPTKMPQTVSHIPQMAKLTGLARHSWDPLVVLTSIRQVTLDQTPYTSDNPSALRISSRRQENLQNSFTGCIGT